ncbi:MAG: hypothetical protein HYY89_00760 [candidate division NC10 bacterium]|nr:hypothetical protein [candidate division NC10 bacterium]
MRKEAEGVPLGPAARGPRPAPPAARRHGEASGDLLGAELATELQRRAPELDLAGMGGDRMAAAGVTLAVQARDMAVVGLTEVLARLPPIWRAYRLLAGMLRDPRPDLLICIDFPEFNLRLARAAARVGIPVCYYVSPQVWASWGTRSWIGSGPFRPERPAGPASACATGSGWSVSCRGAARPRSAATCP